jgi:hypothetical protein
MRIQISCLLVLLVLAYIGLAPARGATPMASWPPTVGQEYPDLDLIDAKGAMCKLKKFQGQVILVEFVGMTCPACSAFAGANDPAVGHFRKVEPQPGLDSLAKLMTRYAHLPLGTPNLAHVVVMACSMKMGVCSNEDAMAWADHFKILPYNGDYVFSAVRAQQPPAVAMVPGFHLIDKSFILRSDAAGDNPKESLENRTLPMIRRLL